jgi:hypothetical protein
MHPTGHPGEDAERRRELTGQLERLRELYAIGDITKPQYVVHRQILAPSWGASRRSRKFGRESR